MMVRAIKQTLKIQPGGRFEFISDELPPGKDAEVIVLFPVELDRDGDCWGLFSDEPDLLDQVVRDAMAAREHPLRLGRG